MGENSGGLRRLAGQRVLSSSSQKDSKFKAEAALARR